MGFRLLVAGCWLLAGVSAFAEEMPTTPFDGVTPVTIETKAFRLVINPDATARSLVLRETGEECLAADVALPVFATTQIRPFNNEIRLVQQVKRTTYPANRIRREGDLLYVGFETAPYQVAVRVAETPAGYATFRAERLISNTTDERQYYHWKMDVPPVEVFRLLQLPIRERANFGDWLNVMWDDRAVVGVMGGTPYMDVDNAKRPGGRILSVDALKDYGVTNGIAVLAVGRDREGFLAQVDAMERDLGLPRGVESRRDSRLNASLFWAGNDFIPENVDEILKYVKKGGFRMLLVYFPSIIRARRYWDLPDYSFNEHWDAELLKKTLDRFHAEGISVGFHVLQTFIGIRSPYVTPKADHRLALARHYTLARPLPATDDPCEVWVEENPVAAPLHPDCRVLKFGTEVLSYEGYSAERPYRFTGVKRRHFGTYAKAHPRGEIGGVLSVCECGAISVYVDQNSSLMDEIAEKLAAVYGCGFDFLYFDGSEDANPPCTINISLSQYRCLRACARTGKTPLFTEGCAKSHFGWHFQSGANAFDVFGPEIFKDRIVAYPCEAVKRLAKDFTRVDFGWWGFWPARLDGPPPRLQGWYKPDCRTVGTQVDMWEYGTSKAAAYDCPATMQMKLETLREHKRTDDILEMVRRWEDVRKRKWLTAAQKEMLRDPAKEYHLYLNGKGAYELLEWRQLEVAGEKWSRVRAFVFERGGKRVVAYWDIADRSELVLSDGAGTLKAGNLAYWETSLDEASVRAAFAGATIRGGREGEGKR